MEASIVIRTLNEARWLGELLGAIQRQRTGSQKFEILIVDSGSTDETLAIAERYGCRIVHIRKEDFTFGRSLNFGCEAAKGQYIVFISGHCIPINDTWLISLLKPMQDHQIDYTYGRQEGFGPTKFSERQLFAKYYPAVSKIPQLDIFCNNANAALRKSVWQKYKFDETLTGLEDMDLAKRIYVDGHKIGYAADSSVHHIHDETWSKVKMRYEREAIALQYIRPEFHISFMDFIRYFVAGVYLDWIKASRERVFFRCAIEVVQFRFMQYFGTYRGNNEHRQLSSRRKDAYFYPR